MPSDPPPPGAGEPPGHDFELLAQRAAAAADRGAARQRDLDADVEAVASAGTPSRRRTSTLVALVALVVVFAAGGAAGWLARGGSTGGDAAVATTTVPSSTTAPATSAPLTSTPLTSTPSADVPLPPVVAPPPDASPPDASPPDASPPATGAEKPQMQHTVRSGESFWAIAEAEVARVAQHQPDLTQVDGYWRALVRANTDRLVHPDNPNLLYAGQVLVLPPVPGSP